LDGVVTVETEEGDPHPPRLLSEFGLCPELLPAAFGGLVIGAITF
jgi:hypothetical protein